MKLIHYAGQQFLTSNSIADALLDYAAALARRGRADRVSIPVLSDGAVSEVDVLIGPASQVVAEIVEDVGDGPQDDQLVDDLRRRTALLHDPRPVVSSGDAAQTVDGYELPDEYLN